MVGLGGGGQGGCDRRIEVFRKIQKKIGEGGRGVGGGGFGLVGGQGEFERKIEVFVKLNLFFFGGGGSGGGGGAGWGGQG